MMIGRAIAAHEALEIHELLTFKNVCATKSAAMAGLVKDQELKTLLQNDFSTAQCHIKELQELMQKSARWDEHTKRMQKNISITNTTNTTSTTTSSF